MVWCDQWTTLVGVIIGVSINLISGVLTSHPYLCNIGCIIHLK